MSFDPNTQELNEDVHEFFPDYGSLNNRSNSKKKGVLSRCLGAAAAAAVIALALVPYVVCHPVAISEDTASISARVLNLEPDIQACYLLEAYPGMSNQAVLEAVARSPQLGTAIPEDGMLILRGLEPQSPYSLAFYTEPDPASGKDPLILGRYTFRTGKFPLPPLLQALKDWLDRPRPDPDPTSVLPDRTEPSTQATEETTLPTQETTVPTQETTAPTEETTVPTEETTVPTEETTVPTTPPSPPPPSPSTPPVGPTITPQQPSANFSLQTGDTFKFDVFFPYDTGFATASRADFVMSHHYRNGMTATDPPVPAEVYQSKPNTVVRMYDIPVGLGDTLRIDPQFYYLNNEGTDTPVPTTFFYEIKPAGFDSSTTVDFQFELQGLDLEYEIHAGNIANAGSPKPSNSGLFLDGIEFQFLDKFHSPIGTPQEAALSQAISGETFSTSGVLSHIPIPAADAKYVQVRLKGMWRVGGQDALRTSTDFIVGNPIVKTEAQTPSVQSIAPVPGTDRSKVRISFPYLVRGVHPEAIRMEASDGINPPTVSEAPVVSEGSNIYSQAMTCDLSPGAALNFRGTLKYDQEGTILEAPGPTVTLRSGSLGSAAGTLSCTYNANRTMSYQLDLWNLVNDAFGSSGLQITDVTFAFTSTSFGGPPKTVSETSVGEFISGGTTTLQKTGVVDLATVPIDSYYVSVTVSGKWIVNGAFAQDLPTTVLINSGTTIDVAPIT